MSATNLLELPELAPVPRPGLGPAVNEQGCCVDRVTDGTYQSTFLTPSDGVVSPDAPPTGGTK